MPVRFLNSRVLKWPDRQAIDEAVRCWAENVRLKRSDVVRIGYFGSYARGDWGVGSDLDLLVVVESSDRPYYSRATEWDVTGLPVPADLLVYTCDEWQSLNRQSRFPHTLTQETCWVYVRRSEG